jgi:hypothetical protein
MKPPRNPGEYKKLALIDGLLTARRSILAAVQTLPASRTDEAFLGVWSVKDLLAHLIGWDHTNLQAVQEILGGQSPSFFQYSDKDWQSYNRRLVQQYRRDSLPDLLSDAAGSHRQLIAFLQALGAAELLDAKARRPNGRTVTIRNLLLSEAGDERQHAQQIVAFGERILHRGP